MRAIVNSIANLINAKAERLRHQHDFMQVSQRRVKYSNDFGEEHSYTCYTYLCRTCGRSKQVKSS